MTATRASRSPTAYDVHPSVSHARAILDNLPEKTGRSIDEWIDLVRASGPGGDRERKEWLRKAHGIGGTTASMIVDRAAGRGNEDTDPAAYLRAAPGYVEEMYGGPKAGLRPVHDALMALGRSLGDDVKVCPCKTIVPLYRHHVFAQIRPSTRTRIDLGLALKGVSEPLPERLIDTGGLAKGDRITHRIPVSAPDEIDIEVERWLRSAYELDA